MTTVKKSKPKPSLNNIYYMTKSWEVPILAQKLLKKRKLSFKAIFSWSPIDVSKNKNDAIIIIIIDNFNSKPSMLPILNLKETNFDCKTFLDWLIVAASNLEKKFF